MNPAKRKIFRDQNVARISQLKDPVDVDIRFKFSLVDFEIANWSKAEIVIDVGCDLVIGWNFQVARIKCHALFFGKPKEQFEEKHGRRFVQCVEHHALGVGLLFQASTFQKLHPRFIEVFSYGGDINRWFVVPALAGIGFAELRLKPVLRTRAITACLQNYHEPRDDCY